MKGNPSRRAFVNTLGTGVVWNKIVEYKNYYQTNDFEFMDDFDYQDISQSGWKKARGDFVTQNSLIYPLSEDPTHKDIYHPQPRATGRFEIKGAKNASEFFGLRFAFINLSKDFRGSNPTGYLISFRGKQGGSTVRFDQTGGSSSGEPLLILDENHGGKAHNLVIERDPNTYEFTFYYDGEMVGTVETETFTESSYWTILFDGGPDSQRVDGIAATSTGKQQFENIDSPVKATDGPEPPEEDVKDPPTKSINSEADEDNDGVLSEREEEIATIIGSFAGIITILKAIQRLTE